MHVCPFNQFVGVKKRVIGSFSIYANGLLWNLSIGKYKVKEGKKRHSVFSSIANGRGSERRTTIILIKNWKIGWRSGDEMGYGNMWLVRSHGRETITMYFIQLAFFPISLLFFSSSLFSLTEFRKWIESDRKPTGRTKFLSWNETEIRLVICGLSREAEK